MVDVCDNMSVGVVVIWESSLLMFDRAMPPYGTAPPAGHVDDHGGAKRAAQAELYEETGLRSTSMNVLWQGWRNNRCRRKTDRAGHYWTVFCATARGALNPSWQETRRMRWVPLGDLPVLAERTRQLTDGEITQEQFDTNPGLEPVWVGLLHRVGMLRCTARQLEGADVRCAMMM